MLDFRPRPTVLRLKAFVGGSNGDNRGSVGIVICNNRVDRIAEPTQPGIVTSLRGCVFIGTWRNVRSNNIHPIIKSGCARGDLRKIAGPSATILRGKAFIAGQDRHNSRIICIVVRNNITNRATKSFETLIITTR